MAKKIIEAVRDAARAFRQRYNEQGEELPDSTPVAVPVGFQRPPTIHEQIRMFVRSEEFNRRAQAAGVETWEEANDFEVGDEEFDEVPTLHEMQEEFVAKAKRDAEEHVKKAREKAIAARKAKEATPPKLPEPEAPGAPPKAT